MTVRARASPASSVQPPAGRVGHEQHHHRQHRLALGRVGCTQRAHVEAGPAGHALVLGVVEGALQRVGLFGEHEVAGVEGQVEGRVQGQLHVGDDAPTPHGLHRVFDVGGQLARRDQVQQGGARPQRRQHRVGGEHGAVAQRDAGGGALGHVDALHGESGAHVDTRSAGRLLQRLDQGGGAAHDLVASHAAVKQQGRCAAGRARGHPRAQQPGHGHAGAHAGVLDVLGQPVVHAERTDAHQLHHGLGARAAGSRARA